MQYKRRFHSVHRDEQGSVTMLFVISSITWVVILALTFNTAATTIRKSQLHAASDSAAQAGGTWMARGLNLTASSNQSMTQMLAVMITVRATLQTAELMIKIEIPLMIKGAASSPYTYWMIPELKRELGVYRSLRSVLKRIDSFLSKIGWKTMKALDYLNQGVKTGFSLIAVYQTSAFAKANGADQFPYGLLLSGKQGIPAPILPLARGQKEELVDQAEECPLPDLKWTARILLILTGPFASPNALITFELMVLYNTSALRGNWLSKGLGRYLNFLMTGPLAWPNDSPRPMLLCDQPSLRPDATMDVKEAKVDLKIVRKHLQLLAITTAKKNLSLLGGSLLKNLPTRWINYAEADCYNPTLWSGFSQDWRVKLARAHIVDEKVEEISRMLGLPGRFSVSFVNTH